MYEKMIQAAVENEADAVVSAYIEERDAGSIRRCMNIKSGVYEKLRLEGMKKKLIYSGGGGIMNLVLIRHCGIRFSGQR